MTTTTGIAVRPWRLATLAGMASYMDAATIVGISVCLALWEKNYGMDLLQIGMLSAVLTVCIGLGAILGGRIGDRWGRKRVYSMDLLIYAFGLLWIVFAVGSPMLFVGVVILGLAVGADIPTSLALVGEMAPPEKRGRLLGLTQMLWSVGGLGVLVIVFVATPLGDLMPRILFGHLFVVALVTWALRRRMPESAAWTLAADKPQLREAQRGRVSDLLHGPLLRGLAFTTAFYLLITLVTNFFGQFGTYMLITVSGLDQQSAVGVSLALFPLGLILVLVFMRIIDTRARTVMFYVGAISQVAAFALLLFVPPTPGAVIVCMAAFLFGAAFAGETNYKVWSQELFPTLLRGTAQGFSFGVARVASAIFAVFIPTLLQLNFQLLIGILVAALVIAGVLGALFQPRAIGRTVAEIDRDSVLEPPSASVGPAAGSAR